MVNDRRRTDRLRPVVPSDVEPRQALQRDEVVLQQQYAMPNWSVDVRAPMVK